MSADITIPDNLKPRDGRFGCGRSKIRQEALSSVLASGASIIGTSHRQKPVKHFLNPFSERLSRTFKLP